MKICDLCEKQTRTSHRGKPHVWLVKMDELRLFKRGGSRGFREQDYECLTCRAKFTQSTNKNDSAWTLWQA